MFVRIMAVVLAAVLFSGCGSDTTGPGQYHSADTALLLVGTNLNNVDRIYTMTPDGSDTILVSGSMIQARSAVWSPDRSMIAYVDGARSISVMNADGSDQRRVHESIEWRIGRLDWSRDGRYIAFDGTSSYSATVIGVVEVESGEVRELLRDGMRQPLEPTWSPDGRRLAFTIAVDGEGRQLHVMNADGSNTRQVTSDPGFWGAPRWAPRGNSIVYVSRREGPADIWRTDADGGRVLRLTDATGATATGPVWSPDGRRIAFMLSTDHADDSVATISADGSDLRLIASPEYLSYLAW